MNPFDRTPQEQNYHRVRQHRETTQCLLEDINKLLSHPVVEKERLQHLLLRLLFDFTHWTAYKNMNELEGTTSSSLEREVLSTIDRIAAILRYNNERQ